MQKVCAISNNHQRCIALLEDLKDKCINQLWMDPNSKEDDGDESWHNVRQEDGGVHDSEVFRRIDEAQKGKEREIL